MAQTSREVKGGKFYSLRKNMCYGCTTNSQAAGKDKYGIQNDICSISYNCFEPINNEIKWKVYESWEINFFFFLDTLTRELIPLHKIKKCGLQMQTVCRCSYCNLSGITSVIFLSKQSGATI